MSAFHLIQSECLDPDVNGFYVARCMCGFSFGPLPDLETLCDALMEHSFDEGAATGAAKRADDELRASLRKERPVWSIPESERPPF